MKKVCLLFAVVFSLASAKAQTHSTPSMQKMDKVESTQTTSQKVSSTSPNINRNIAAENQLKAFFSKHSQEAETLKNTNATKYAAFLKDATLMANLENDIAYCKKNKPAKTQALVQELKKLKSTYKLN